MACLGSAISSVSDAWTGGCGFDTQLQQTFLSSCLCLSPLIHVRLVVSGFGKKVVFHYWCEKARKHRCITECHDMFWAVKMASNSKQTYDRVQNTVGKGKMMGTNIFSFFTNVFKSFVFQGRYKARLSGQELTLSQTTNFRLFQTERVCRRWFQIWRKWKKSSSNR